MASNIDKFLDAAEHASTSHAGIPGVETLAPSFAGVAVSPVAPLIHKPLGGSLDTFFPCPVAGLATELGVKLSGAGAHTFVVKVAGAPVATVVTPAGPGAFSVAIGPPAAIPAGADIEVDYTVGPGPVDVVTSLLVRA